MKAFLQMLVLAPVHAFLRLVLVPLYFTLIRLCVRLLSVSLCFYLIFLLLGHATSKTAQVLWYYPGRPGTAMISTATPVEPKWPEPYLEVIGSFPVFPLVSTEEELIISVEVGKAELIAFKLETVLTKAGGNLKARDSLARHIFLFHRDSSRAARQLRKLALQTMEAADMMLATNNDILQTIRGFSDSNPSQAHAGMSVTSAILTDRVTSISSNMEFIVSEIESSLRNLNNLEEHLRTIQNVLALEELSLRTEQSKLSDRFWTKIGRNQKALKNLDSHALLLQVLGRNNQEALVYVARALQVLLRVSTDLEDVQERASSFYSSDQAIPEAYVRSIQLGLMRLRDASHQIGKSLHWGEDYM